MAINSRQRTRRAKKRKVCKPSSANIKIKVSTRNVKKKAKKK